MQGGGERGILHRNEEEGVLRTQLLVQREEEERERFCSTKLAGRETGLFQGPDRFYTCVVFSDSAF